MKKQIITAIISLLALNIHISAQPKSNFTDNANNITNEKKLNDIQWIEKATEVAVEDNDIPAIVIGIIKNGKVVKFITKGTFNRKNGKKVDENTIFQIGSLTKTFTGIIAKNLIKEGKLSVNSSITEYLPNTLSPKAKAKLSKISVENLLQHQSGIPRDSKVYYRFGNDPMICCYTETDLLTDLELMKLDFEPGSKSVYSNIGFAVLGYILERASAKSYDELVQIYVSEKYNLPNTTTKLSKSQKNFLATPYRKEYRAFETKPFEMGKMVSGGGIYSTASDLSKLIIQQNSDYQAFLESNKESSLILTKHTKPFSQGVYYGYGLFKTDDGGYGHGGDLDGFASHYDFFPNKNFGVVLLTSSGGGWVVQLQRLIIKKMLNEPVKMLELSKTVSISKDKISKYTGTYKIGNNIFHIVQKGNKLEAYLQSKLGPIEMSFESKTKIFSKAYGQTIEYEFDANENVKKVFFVEGGKKYEMQKLD